MAGYVIRLVVGTVPRPNATNKAVGEVIGDVRLAVKGTETRTYVRRNIEDVLDRS